MSNMVEAAGLLLFTRAEPTQFLLMRHADRWDLPKGHAELNETILQTALRETEEETGIAANSICVDEAFRFVMEYYVVGKKRGDYHKRVTYFLGTVEQPVKIRLTEHIGYQWFDWPVSGSIQTQTIDPLLAAVAQHRS
jgi:8-oxo-dGTP pyrophosphatase MutT (NUDIX family)